MSHDMIQATNAGSPVFAGIELKIVSGVGRRMKSTVPTNSTPSRTGLSHRGRAWVGRECRRRDLGRPLVGLEAGDAQRSRCNGPNEYRTMQ